MLELLGINLDTVIIVSYVSCAILTLCQLLLLIKDIRKKMNKKILGVIDIATAGIALIICETYFNKYISIDSPVFWMARIWCSVLIIVGYINIFIGMFSCDGRR